MSGSQFLTQAPFSTQQPTTTPDIEDDLLSQTHDQEGLAESVDPLPPSAQHVQPVSDRLTPGEIVGRNAETASEVPNSSDGSIECQPYVLPGTDPKTKPTQVSPDADAQSDVDLQPFPLVDWIKRIRAETPRRWPTFPLRWARSISKEQQNILNQDDAWSPPLAGRPARPGTVPICLLDILTEKADKAALHAQAQVEVTQRNSETPSLKAGSKHTAADPSVAAVETSQRVDGESDVGSEPETELASQWSSSPPREPNRPLPPDTSPPRPLPPDTSFVRQSTFHEPGEIHVGTQQRHGHDGASDGPGEEQQQFSPDSDGKQLAESDEEFGSSPPEPNPGVDNVGHKSQGVTEPTTQQSASQVNDESTQHDADEARKEDLPKKATPKVQVKDTPFPKPILKQRQPRIDDLPPSSFVGATYPSISPRSNKKMAYAVQRNVDLPDLPRTASSQNASQIPANEVKLDAITVQLAPARLPVIVVDEQREDEIGQEQPPRKRIRLSPVRTRTTDPDYKQIDERRILERRRTRKAFCAPRPASRDSSGQNAVRQKSVSRTSSPQHTDKRSHGLASESGRTTATNFSMHRTITYEPVIRRQAPLTTALNTNVLASLLLRYRTAYPMYEGDEKAFASAIRLIVGLRLQPREPHPSLWDDFIYRKSDDYKAHLQRCIDEGDNALPYQDFYHIHVKRSGRSQEVITEEVLGALYADPEGDSRHHSLAGNEESRSLRDNPSHEEQPVESLGAPSYRTVEPGPEERDTCMQIERPERLPGEDQPGETAGPRESLKTRQSLPQPLSHNGQEAIQFSHNVTSEAVASAPRSSASEKVEEWLNSSGHAIDEAKKSTKVPLPQNNPPSMLQGKQEKVPRGPEGTKSTPDHVPMRRSIGLRANNSSSPETDMARFVRQYASLQSERQARSATRGQLPINVYMW